MLRNSLATRGHLKLRVLLYIYTNCEQFFIDINQSHCDGIDLFKDYMFSK